MKISYPLIVTKKREIGKLKRSYLQLNTSMKREDIYSLPKIQIKQKNDNHTDSKLNCYLYTKEKGSNIRHFEVFEDYIEDLVLNNSKVSSLLKPTHRKR